MNSEIPTVCFKNMFIYDVFQLMSTFLTYWIHFNLPCYLFPPSFKAIIHVLIYLSSYFFQKIFPDISGISLCKFWSLCYSCNSKDCIYIHLLWKTIKLGKLEFSYLFPPSIFILTIQHLGSFVKIKIKNPCQVLPDRDLWINISVRLNYQWMIAKIIYWLAICQFDIILGFKQ